MPEACPEASRANARSSAEWKRRPGRLSRQRWTILASPGGISPPSRVSSGGSSFRIAVSVSAGVSAWNARRPDSISYRTAPKGEDVGAVVHLVPAHLLRGHVADGAHDRPRFRRRIARHGVVGSLDRRLGARQLGEAEVEDLDASVFHHEEVLGLEVAVDDPLGVRGAEASRDLRAVADRLADRKGTLAQPPAQRLALEQLTDQVRSAFVRADVVEIEDVRVIQRAGRAGFLLEALEPMGILRDLLGQDLDRNLATETAVSRSVDLTHPPGPERPEDLIAAEACSGRKRQPASPPGLSGRGYTLSARPLTPGPCSKGMRCFPAGAASAATYSCTSSGGAL
jgi:hypothetical protein